MKQVALILCLFAIVFITTTVGQVEPKWPIPAIYRRQRSQSCKFRKGCAEHNQVIEMIEGFSKKSRRQPLSWGNIIYSSIVADRYINRIFGVNALPPCMYGEKDCENGYKRPFIHHRCKTIHGCVFIGRKMKAIVILLCLVVLANTQDVIRSPSSLRLMMVQPPPNCLPEDKFCQISVGRRARSPNI
ncbi:uncharacterized protein LOC125763597 isoform X2 [Anopheles funestus]|uniref:uncharacterized protein LOC125763597 isoform X2 n=1 Tax=Anopheles funestus TaxID=62324 RepID=UPI0020C70E07|nr:uncharacterized protein LOC125763597 isoform X2 [Anopheles funestus]